MKTLLAIDIGNTSITFGIFRRSRLMAAKVRDREVAPTFVFRLPTDASSKTLKMQLGKLKRHKVDSIITCSVVPKMTIVLMQALKQQLGIRARVVGKDIRVPVKNLYKKQSQVGRDRLVNAYACKLFYGTPAVIIDFGTATTFDYINKKGQYEGGIIAPGIEISLQALYQKTALLPKIDMKVAKAFVGKNTKDSIRSGASFGLAYMCDGLIEAFKKRYGSKIKVIATGGLASFFKKRCKNIDIVDKALTLKGLRLLDSSLRG